MDIELQFILQDSPQICKPKFKRGDIKRKIYRDLYTYTKTNLCYSNCCNPNNID